MTEPKSTSDAGASRDEAGVAVAENLQPVSPERSHISEEDLYMFNEGSHLELYDRLGSRVRTLGGVQGVAFAVWAPNAEAVSVVGDFNGWSADRHELEPRGQSGIWEGFVPGLEKGAVYKYDIRARGGDFHVLKADPFAFHHEVPPRTASIVWDLEYEWSDEPWMTDRLRRNALDAPISIYEVHLGSWCRRPEEGNRPLGYREIAPLLADYVEETGFTHVEFLPLMEHPFYGSWGYQTTGYFAPTARYGTPQDLMYLIDTLHQRGIGVILDWVPSHFPVDEHALGLFDGTHLYEHRDPREGFHPDWNSYIFNYGRHEVRSFLLSSALMWFDRYHIDGLRVDAVASMLYRDYSRGAGEWIPNEHGGRENLEAIHFLRRLNSEIFQRHPDVQTYAEESTAWPMVSRPTYLGGLGFGLKWDMGWMHDALEYFHQDPVHRRYRHDRITFRSLYAFNENFVLPLSHDEVVHGKGSLLAKMPGDDWQKRANLRLLLGQMFLQPGKKLLFMGGELGQWSEWSHERSLDWHLLDDPAHRGLRRWVRDLNTLYRAEPALHAGDHEPDGFEWIDANDSSNSVYSFLRRDPNGDGMLLVICNMTPVPRSNYRVGVPRNGYWTEVLNGDATIYGGSGRGNLGGCETVPIRCHARRYSLTLELPPLAVVVLRAPTVAAAQAEP